jgi:hypothetical protein
MIRGLSLCQRLVGGVELMQAPLAGVQLTASGPPFDPDALVSVLVRETAESVLALWRSPDLPRLGTAVVRSVVTTVMMLADVARQLEQARGAVQHQRDMARRMDEVAAQVAARHGDRRRIDVRSLLSSVQVFLYVWFIDVTGIS